MVQTINGRERAIWRVKDGVEVMPDPQKEYLEWLLDPMRVPDTHKAYAERHSIPERTLRHWRNDIRFQKEWRAAAQEANVSPERTQAVIENMWRIAAKGDGPAAVKAGEVYLKFTELFTPTQKIIVADDSVERMSDEELRQLLEAGD